jgi:hypothetical protein
MRAVLIYQHTASKIADGMNRRITRPTAKQDPAEEGAAGWLG